MHRATVWTFAASVCLHLSVGAQDPGDYNIDFVGAVPTTYNHTVGGGAYNDRTLGEDVDTTLAAAEFSSGDIVRYFATISVDPDGSANPQTVEFDLVLDAASSGDAGAALAEIVDVHVNYGCVSNGDDTASCLPAASGLDTGNNDDGGSVATLLSEVYSVTIFAAGSDLLATVSVSDLEAGEQVVVAIDARLATLFGSAPTGNLDADLTAARLSSAGDQVIAVAPQTVSLIGLTDLSMPPSVTTDKYDYLPGETAYINGSGYWPGEVVELQVTHVGDTADDGEGHDAWAVVADGRGAFQTSWTVCTDDCFGEVLLLTATGLDSTRRSVHYFADDGSGNADVLQGLGCMQDVAGFGLNCTANDVRIAGIQVIDGVEQLEILDDGCAFPGDTVTFTATFEVVLTAQARHDVGLWFAIDGDPNGDGAVSGECTVATPAYAPDPPWLDLDGTGDKTPGTNDVPGDQDTCGDIDDAHNPLFPVVTITANCVDEDGNGQLDLPNCTSWRQPGANDLCTSPADAFPGAPSKCRCDPGFSIPIEVPGLIRVNKVTVDANDDPLVDPTLFDFSITGPDGDLPDVFQLAGGDAAHESPGLDAPFPNGNLYTVSETSVPDGWELVSANCVSEKGNADQDPTAGAVVVEPGEVLECTFINKLVAVPEIDCPGDVTIACDGSTDPVDTGTATTSGLCGNDVTVGYSDETTGDLCAGFTILRTWTATWNSGPCAGETATCVQTITIEGDTTPPEITCPSGFTVECVDDVPPCSPTDATATDDCGTVTITCVQGPLVGGPCGGTVTNTYTAEDDCGNKSMCTQVITVIDTIAPSTVTCPDDVTVTCAEDVPDPDPNLVSATDNCGPVTITHVSDVSDGESCPEIITRTYRATDACGNTADCTQLITVEDTEDPVLVGCPADTAVQCYSAVPAAAAVTATDNCDVGLLVDLEETESNPGSSCNNVITRTWTVTDSCGNTATCMQTITVNDTTAPTIVCPDPLAVQCGDDVPAADTSLVTASDLCGPVTVSHVGDVSDGNSCPEIITRTYRATDACGNTADCTQLITVEDTEDPVLAGCPADIAVQCYSAVPAAAAVTATDNCDVGLLVDLEETESNPGSSCNNVITRTWTVTDSCGNTATCMQTITVNDTTAPTIVCPDPLAVQCGDDVPAADTSLVTASDLCGPVTVSHVGDVSDGNSCPEIITRTYRATDACGNTADCTQLITVEDTEDPVLAGCPADIAVQCYSAVPAAAAVTATDNCDVGLLVDLEETESNPGSSCNNVITRTWTVTDSCGNTATCMQTITVNDTTAPTIVCPDPLAVQCGDDVPAADTSLVTASDLCGPVTVSHVGDVSDGNSCPEIITRTYRATDACGNTADCTQLITVEDTEDPVLVGCPADTAVQCYSAVPAAAAVTATDNCDVGLLVDLEETESNPGSSCNNVITRTWTVTDSCGNTATCMQTITVNDTTAPTIVCPDPLAVQCGDGVPAADTSLVTASDLCGPVTVSHVGDVSDGNSCPEIITRTYRATDACGNTADCTQLITVEDTEDPVLVGCPADTAVQCYSAVPAAAAVTATDNCDVGLLVDLEETESNPGSSCNNVITRTWTVTDSCGNTATCMQTITVNDTTAPTIVCPDPLAVQCGDDVPAADTSLVTASDLCGPVTVSHVGDVSDGNSCPEIITRTYRATDACGNTADCTQLITVEDTEDPVLVGCPADTAVQCYSAVPAAAAVTATDNCDVGLLVDLEETESNPGSSCNNVITRTWTVTDSCGNTATCMQTITVNDTTAPTIVCPDPLAVQCGDDVPAADTSLVTASDLCGPVTVSHVGDVSDGNSCPEIITRTYRATDACGNTADCTQLITVEDTEDPVLVGCPADTAVQCYSAVPAAAAVTATDNCDVGLLVDLEETESNPGSSCNNVITRTWTVTDSCGNTATCMQTITVNDTTAPTIVCPDPLAVQCGDDVPAADTSLVTASDLCGPVTVSHVGDVSDGNSCPEIITRTYRATDACGNYAECTQLITVQDTEAPTIVCPENVIVQCDGDVPAPDTNLATSDNCLLPVVVTHVGDESSGSCPKIITRTYRATDACGNYAECTQLITVQDTEAPTIVCPQDVIVQCDGDVPAPDTNLTTSDNCLLPVVVTHVGDESSGSCPKIITRTYRATDACGNYAECTQLITVQDTEAPTIVCPENVIVQCDGDVPAPDTNLATSDNCLLPVVVTHVGDESSGSCPKIITRTYRATDACGNYAECTQVITVQDTEAPTIVCPENVIVQCDGDVPAPDTNLATSDNCLLPVVVTHVGDESSGSCPKIITRTYRATDACGNYAECTQLITVQDTEAPTIVCPQDVIVQCDGDVPAPDTNLATSDNCLLPVVVTHVGDESSGSCPKVITRTYRATDACGNTAECTQLITVDDTIAPTIVCPQDVTVQCDGDVPAPDTNLATSDNCLLPVVVTHVGDESSGSCPRIITRTYRATDACGNTADCTQLITVDDTEQPVLAGCPVDTNVAVQCYTMVPLAPVVTATDNCDGVVDVNFSEVESNPSSSCNNVITRTWTATDSCGNSVSCTQTITVNDTQLPVFASCPDDTEVQCISDLPPVPDLTATDSCDSDVMIVFSEVQSNPGSSCNNIVTRTWTATDDCNNSVVCEQIITVNDTTPPEMICPPDDFLVGCTPGAPCDISGEPTVTDNCDPSPIVEFSDDVVGDCPRRVTRTWTATDACGNQSTCVQTLTCLPEGAVTSSSLCAFDTNSKEGSQFNLIFTPAGAEWPAYKITSTNPGQFFYNLFYDAGAPGDSVSFDITIPYPFVTQGANPVHLYDSVSLGTEDGDLCYAPGDAFATPPLEITLDTYQGASEYTFTVDATVPASGFIYLNIHLDYGLKGPQLDANPADGNPDRYDQGACLMNPDETSAGCHALFNDTTDVAIPTCADHTFSHDTLVGGEVADSFSETVQNINVFKRFVGVLASTLTTPAGDPVSELQVYLIRESTGETVASGVTDEDGIAPINYKHRGRRAWYRIEVPALSHSRAIELKANGFGEVKILVAGDGTVTSTAESVITGGGNN